jgi:hypothetical protein
MTQQQSGVVRDIMNSISTVEFRIDQPGENRLLLRQRAVWFVWSTDIKNPRVIGPLKAAWKDRDGGIWLETSKIVDMISLVEREYGEKGIHVMPDAKQGAAPSEGIPAEVEKFPRVVSLLEACEKRVSDMSEESGIPLKVLFDGGEGVTTFRIGAKIESPPTDTEALKLKILMVASVLKEAYKAVLDIVWPPEDS